MLRVGGHRVTWGWMRTVGARIDGLRFRARGLQLLAYPETGLGHMSVLV